MVLLIWNSISLLIQIWETFNNLCYRHYIKITLALDWATRLSRTILATDYDPVKSNTMKKLKICILIAATLLILFEPCGSSSRNKQFRNRRKAASLRRRTLLRDIKNRAASAKSLEEYMKRHMSKRKRQRANFKQKGEKLDVVNNTTRTLSTKPIRQNACTTQICDCSQVGLANCSSRHLIRIPLSGKNSKTLDLGGNDIKEVRGFAFTHWGHHLKVLNLNNNKIRYINAKAAFIGLRNVRKAYLQYNSLQRIGAATFQWMKSIEEIRLDNNLISSIHPYTFLNLHNLKTIGLHNNKLVNLHADSFVTFMLSSNLRYLFKAEVTFSFLCTK